METILEIVAEKWTDWKSLEKSARRSAVLFVKFFEHPSFMYKAWFIDMVTAYYTTISRKKQMQKYVTFRIS